jgi:hypothetical protein
MFSAFFVIGAFVIGAIFGAGCLALAFRLGQPLRESEEPPTIVPVQPRHRPISGSDFGPGVVKTQPTEPARAHRPIAGG